MKLRFLRIGERGFDLYLSQVEGRIAQGGFRLEKGVRSILEDVRKRGDRAILHYTRVFDGVELQIDQLQLERKTITQAYSKVPKEFLDTLKKAAHRINRFHQLSGKKFSEEWVEKGIRIRQVIRPLERVGVYVPGGKASYPSTVLMNVIPAQVAGVKEIALCVPTPKGEIDPYVMAAIKLLGLKEVYGIGGAQAVGEMAYCTT